MKKHAIREKNVPERMSGKLPEDHNVKVAARLSAGGRKGNFILNNILRMTR